MMLLYVAAVTIICSSMYAQESSLNQLMKVFHHQGSCTDKTKNIELGSVVFYFSQKPEVNTLQSADKKRNATQEKVVLFFPKAKGISDEVKDMIQHFNNVKGLHYTTRLEWVKKPTDGLMLTITYDPQEVSMKYATFDTIGGKRPQPGIIFHFYNQALVNNIQQKAVDRGLLNVAFAQERPNIIIDCGHGGKDYGAVGLFNVREKDVALAVGKQVADELKKKGFSVEMTRSDDFFIALDERTTFANNVNNPGLFLSIHANASVNKNDAGIETYYLDPQLLKDSVRFLDDAAYKVTSQYDAMRMTHSKLLAQLTHASLLQSVRKVQQGISDRNVHPTVLQVLLGTSMPSALIEIGFVSNPIEAKLLMDKQYQQSIAQGICNGVMSYFNTLTAL